MYRHKKENAHLSKSFKEKTKTTRQQKIPIT